MRTTIPGCALALLGLALAGHAHAQWKWLDAGGQVNYSDQPPPLSVPAARILSKGSSLRTAPALAATAGSGAARAAGPGQAAAADGSAPVPASAAGAPTQAASTAPGAPGSGVNAAPAAGGPLTPAERLNEMRKQQALKEAKEREAEQQQRAQAGTAQWCEELRGRERLLASGMRVARVDASGDQAFMGDEERTAQLQAIRTDLETHCAAGS